MAFRMLANDGDTVGWRRERDSNPRYGCPYTRSPGVRLQPLGHPSMPVFSGAAEGSERPPDAQCGAARTDELSLINERPVGPARASGLGFSLGAGARDDLDQPVGAGDSNAVGDIAPGAVEHALGYIVLLPDRADLNPVGAAHMPDNLDMLLVGLDRRDRYLAIEDHVGLRVGIIADCL